MKKGIKFILGLLMAVIIFLLAGEAVIRIFPTLIQPRPPYDMGTLDDRIGWKTKGKYAFEGTMDDNSGKKYPISITTTAKGFRKGMPGPSSGAKIMIVGDSYTQAAEVSDTNTYYYYLSELWNSDIVAYGAAGFGSYQELLILNRYMDEVSPDFVMLQFCTNDFIDNYAPLEIESRYKVGLSRPYMMEDKKILWVRPVSKREKSLERSHFYKFCRIYKRKLLTKMDVLNEDVAEEKIATLGKDYEYYQTSYDITKMIMQKIQEQVEKTCPFIVFCSDDAEPQISDIETICKELNIQFYNAPIHDLNEAKSNGEVIYASDGYHWNPRGHQIVAQALARFAGSN